MGLLAIFFSALLALVPQLAPARVEQAIARQAQKGELTIELEPAIAASALALPKVYGTQGRPLVVLDPGHGGHDPGARSQLDGRAEKDITLELANAIKDELLASGKVRVALTREDDRFVVLRDRYEMARRLDAGLFISVHADASPTADAARGATIYTLSEVASDREAAMLAERQNKSDIIGGVDLGRQHDTVGPILIDLAQRESMDASAQFASLLRREGSQYFPFREEYHRFAALAVLKAPDMPSILLETGYLTNLEDAAYIQSPEGQKAIAAGIRRAVETHFARRIIQVARR